MKKISLLTAVLLLSVLLLSSCTTVGAKFGARVTEIVNKVRFKTTEFTEKDADYALKTTLERSINSTNNRFYQKIGTVNFIPDYLSILVQNKESIPGMRKLVEKWNSIVSQVLTDNREQLEKIIISYAQKLEFNEAKSLVAKSNTSASQLLFETSGDDISDFFKETLKNIDTTVLENAVKQYNAWITTENYKKGTNLQGITYKDCKEELALISFNYYKDTLATLEEFYRTTPDPHTDIVCQNVFGIQ